MRLTPKIARWRPCALTGARGLFYASNCHASDSPLLLELEFEQGMLRLADNELWQICGDERVKLASDVSPDGVGKSYWGIVPAGNLTVLSLTQSLLQRTLLWH
jgi:hypothetical protein